MNLAEIFDYNSYANKKLFQSFTNNLDEKEPEIYRLLNHIIAAHQIWLSRIGLTESKLSTWPELSIKDLKLINEKNEKLTGEAIKSMSFDKSIHYKNSIGKEYTNSVK